jgi:hypothetical protein
MNAYLVVSPHGKNHLGDLDIDKRIILKCIGYDDLN